MIQHKRQLHGALGVQLGMSVTGNNNIHIGNVGVEGGSKTTRIGKRKIKALAATVKEQTLQIQK